MNKMDCWGCVGEEFRIYAASKEIYVPTGNILFFIQKRNNNLNFIWEIDFHF